MKFHTTCNQIYEANGIKYSHCTTQTEREWNEVANKKTKSIKALPRINLTTRIMRYPKQFRADRGSSCHFTVRSILDIVRYQSNIEAVRKYIKEGLEKEQAPKKVQNKRVCFAKTYIKINKHVRLLKDNYNFQKSKI